MTELRSLFERTIIVLFGQGSVLNPLLRVDFGMEWTPTDSASQNTPNRLPTFSISSTLLYAIFSYVRF